MSTDTTAFEPARWIDPEADSPTPVYFDGDEGGLALAQRKALVVLLKNRFVTPQSHPDQWKALLADVSGIRSRLHDMFLDLYLDRDREVAYKFQVNADGGARFPTLLHATDWPREETILLVRLRRVAHAARAAGDSRVFVDRADLLEYLAAMRPATATDQSGDTRRTSRAIEALVSAGLLVGRMDAERFEISRAVDVVLPLETLRQLRTWIRDADHQDPVTPADPTELEHGDVQQTDTEPEGGDA